MESIIYLVLNLFYNILVVFYLWCSIYAICVGAPVVLSKDIFRTDETQSDPAKFIILHKVEFVRDAEKCKCAESIMTISLGDSFFLVDLDPNYWQPRAIPTLIFPRTERNFKKIRLVFKMKLLFCRFEPLILADRRQYPIPLWVL